MKKYKIAVCGASGMVGNMMLKVLEERNFPIETLKVLSSKKSAGKEILFQGKPYLLEELNEHSFDEKIDIALFSAGGSVSEKFAPIAAEHGCVVVDNSSQFRMEETVPLVVPEVNPEDIKKHKGIIANPNCSTIQSVLPLKPLYDKYGIKRVIYTTYQAVSGAGMAGYNDLKNGVNGEEPKKFDYPIAFNLIPQIDSFLENGYTKEEMKMINETRKILHDDRIQITATTVRVPVFNSHSVAINVELEKDFDLDEVKKLFQDYEGIVLLDDIEQKKYPMPILADGKDEVFVGRIRRDFSQANTLNFFSVADNIRKGAATNAVQIAEKLIAFL
ncbi:MAG: aspartate-semialdehyde dehydrogenase [Bacillota bacterium]|nr:aspartate-semialdehyde dehydrogenase [Bacillota bacterium]